MNIVGEETQERDAEGGRSLISPPALTSHGATVTVIHEKKGLTVCLIG